MVDGKKLGGWQLVAGGWWRVVVKGRIDSSDNYVMSEVKA
jgi:hypothetical protein